MRILFMGTPSFAVSALAALHARGHEIAGVVTQPDRPSGRGQQSRASAVKRWALAHSLPVEQPEKLRDPAVVERLRGLAPDAIVVAAYGKILPKALLELPPKGAINVHGSLLPRYRGAAPIQRALLAGDCSTGITIMQMNERMDAGDILLQEETPIAPDDTSESLAERLARVGARLLTDALDRLERGRLTPQPQNDADATLAPMVRKEEGAIDWRRSAVEIERAVRAFTPWPGAYTRLSGKLLKIHRASVESPSPAALPGTVVRAERDRLEVATAAGVLRIHEAQLEGRRRLGAVDLVAGHALREGDRLG